MVHCHKPAGVLCEKLDCCFQGQGHSEGSKCQWMFFWRMSSEPPNILLPNLLWWYIIIRGARVSYGNIALLSSGQGHSKSSYDQNMSVPTVSFELLILLQPNLVLWIFIIKLSVLWKKEEEKNDCCFQGKVTVKLQNVSEYLDEIFWTTELFITKLGMVMFHYEPECHVEKLFLLSSGSGSQLRLIL